MSFGWTAATWAAIGVGTTAVVAADASDTARKAANAQKDAILAAKEADALQVAKAGENANAAMVDSKRRRRAAGGLTATADPAAGVSVLGSAGPSAGGGGMGRPLMTTLGR